MSPVPSPDPRPGSLPVPQGSEQERMILHLDMDSFYASVEMQKRPELQKKPVVIGADPKQGRGRGVVCTCSYEARAFGIHSAMPVSRAFVLCPHAIFLPPDFEHYSRVSLAIMDLLRSFGLRFLQVSIDEAFLDVTPCGSYGAATAFAGQIQETIHNRFGLTCSVGIAPGKIVAKIASDYKKPGGITVVGPRDVREFLAPMPVRKIPGVGKKSEAELLELDIKTIGDLAVSNIQVLLGRFGHWAVPLHELSLGIDTSELEEYDGIKSVSRETTFDSDSDDPGLLLTNLETLAIAVHRNLVEETLRCKTVTIKLRYEGFVTRTRSHTLSHFTGELEPIRRICCALLKEMYDGRKVRLIGIRLSYFEKQDRCQMTLDS
jgi:DNA polymerase IV (archaeal DinB-like DNA polymerase)